jgi:hypothetical protein
MLLVLIELNSVQKTTDENGGQGVAYTDYSVFKNKYEELYGNKYSFDEDIKKTDYISNCKNFPSIANKNKLCWVDSFGIVGSRSLHIDSKKEENNQYIIEGRYQMDVFDDDISDDDDDISDDSTNAFDINGTFTIIYDLKNNKKYLNTIALKSK